MDDEDLDHRLAGARARRALEAVAASDLERLLADTKSRASKRRTRHSRAVVVGAVLTLGVGTIATPAAADALQRFLAQTGGTCPAGSTECVVGDDELDLDAPDLDPLIASKFPDYLTLPPGMSRDQAIVATQEQFTTTDGLGSDQLVLGAYEYVAYCGWVGEWLSADKEDRLDDRAAATAVLRESLDWPGPLQTSPDTRFWQGAFAQAAEEGDAAGVATAGAFNHCEVGTISQKWLDTHRPSE